MKNSLRWVLYSLLAILFILHNDYWFWQTPQMVLGLPIGILYHIMYCFVASLIMFSLVKYTWRDK